MQIDLKKERSSEQVVIPESLVEPYKSALKEAVSFVMAKFAPLGIVAAGSVLRGQGHPSSDIDLYVLVDSKERQAIRKRFAGVPFEIFINSPAAVRTYFKNESTGGRPITAHMLATGSVVFSRGSALSELRAEAEKIIKNPPPLKPEAREYLRYCTACLFEDGLDLVKEAPENSFHILASAVRDAIHFFFLEKDQYIPREKFIIKELAKQAPELAQLVRDFYNSTTIEERSQLAVKIADSILGHHGFYENETKPEVFPK